MSTYIYETIPDTGGPGKNRGGNGLRIGYRFLEPGEISIHDDRWLTYPWGVNGGTPGGRSNKVMVRKDGSRQYFPAKCDKVKVEPGDTLYFNTWGGGGWGDPFKREPARVSMDARRGLTTRDGARRYGVVLNEDLSVDENETRRLRERMTGDRGPVQMFDRGGTIEELKARCKRDTHLEPPTAPVFQNWMQRRPAAQAAE